VEESVNSMRSKFTDVYEVSHILETIVRELAALVFNIPHKESEAIEVSRKRLFVTLGEVSEGFELFEDVVSSHSMVQLIL